MMDKKEKVDSRRTGARQENGFGKGKKIENRVGGFE